MAGRLGAPRGGAILLTRALPSARATTTLDEILEMLTEARSVGDELGDDNIQEEAMGWRVVAFMALGELEAARRELAEFLEDAKQARQPFWHFAAELIGSAVALCEGHVDEAEARAEHSRELES